MRFLFLITWMIASQVVFAQSAGSISGTIISSNGKALDGATVKLLHTDSTVVALTAANKNGSFIFKDLALGNYFISATAAGHQKVNSSVIVLEQLHPAIQLPALSLSMLTKEIAGVIVTAKRSLIEQRIDRTIVNVDASITNAGTNALELLEKSPGVSVDRDGNISLKGKEGVMVMIDGRLTQLGGPDLANLLRSMSSSQLDQIEIMTNPPANYDAAGTAGIINIKTKKVVKGGLNGSVNISYGQGRYPKTTEGFNFNYREGKVNLFTNLSHNYGKRFSTLSIDRKIFATNSSIIQQIFNQKANRISTTNAYNARFGIDFFANKKTTFGAVVNLSSRDLSSANPNVTYISNSAKELQTVTSALVDTKTDWNSISTNLNFRRVLDKKGKELTSDVDLAKHSMVNDLFMINSYVNAQGNAFNKPDTLMGILPQDINVYSTRVDYVQPLKNKGRLEAGVKASFVKTDNDARYDSIQSGKMIPDLMRSNHFVYEENINAIYGNLSSNFSKKISAQLGLRLENTNAKGTQLTTGETFERHYTQLFPTAYFQYEANDKNNFGANIGRRISRPNYQSLNPFIRFIDRYTFSQGNPALKPSESTNIELTHTWKAQITTTLNYTHVKDIIHEVIQQKGQEAYNKPSNVSSLDQFGIAISANTPVTKWWSSNININLYNDNYKGTINDASIDRSATSFTINGTQQFKLTKKMTAELNGRYRSSSLEGVLRVQPVGVVGAGLSRQVLKTRGMIRLTARDIFRSQKLTGVTRYGNVDAEMRQISETRIVTIGFSYNFSKGKKVPPVKRTEGSAGEEQGRIGN